MCRGGGGGGTGLFLFKGVYLVLGKGCLERLSRHGVKLPWRSSCAFH